MVVGYGVHTIPSLVLFSSVLRSTYVSTYGGGNGNLAAVCIDNSA